jgi:hypothetical protein
MRPRQMAACGAARGGVGRRDTGDTDGPRGADAIEPMGIYMPRGTARLAIQARLSGRRDTAHGHGLHQAWP